MPNARSLVALDFGSANAADTSRKAHEVRRIGSVQPDPKNRLLRLDGSGSLEVAPSEEMAHLDSFTVDVELAVDRTGSEQQIIQGKTLPVSLRVAQDGKIVGAVQTTQGWETVDSGERKLSSGERVRVRLVHEAGKSLRLEIDDATAGVTQLRGELRRTEEGGLVVGADGGGKAQAFHGTIAELKVQDGAVDAMAINNRERRAGILAAQLKQQLKFNGRVVVELDPDAVDHRFDPIKAIMNAAGVQDLSQLATLRIDRQMVIQPNMLLVAPRKAAVVAVDWSALANTIATADVATAVATTAAALPNRHSRAALDRALKVVPAATEGPSPVPVAAAAKASPAVPAAAAGDLVATGIGVTNALRARATIRPLASIERPLLREILRPVRGLEVVKPTELAGLDGDRPAAWPAQSTPLYFMQPVVSVPVDTSVIIAGILDLTDKQLVIEPSVKTLYIIAEEIVGAPNASITWRRPGGSTPPMADDPGKNGRSYSGVVTADGSRNGLRGGDGQNGVPGLPAASGVDAPSLEIWVKKLTAMPDIDLDGENGIKGGRGQRGGRGGNGARGAGGEWWWCFGVRCWKSPGHGGNGGDGGDGGRGGPGGDGGCGGTVAIGVLEGTLADSVTARAFKISTDGGQPGQGGDGGAGGMGGYGGTHGNDYHDGQEVCGDGVDGTHGAQGQPGPAGAVGRLGAGGTLRFFEFTEESWNEQLTRPWLYELTPVQAFPAGTLNITGSRFADTDRVVLDTFTLTPTPCADESIDVTIPSTITGGVKEVYIRRYDGSESNRLLVWIKPQLDAITQTPVPGSAVALTGKAFVAGASIWYDGAAVTATDVTRTSLNFVVPSAAQGVSAEHAVTIAVRNPDGLVSNERTVTIPRTVESGFKVDVHGLSFLNPNVGAPSWDTFEDTFGALEVWHELLDPLFGHPILTPAFYAFYHYFLKGEGDGGLATGFCTAMSAKALDEFWTGSTDTYTRITLTDAVRHELTGIHGRLLSRESLTDFHDQGRNGTPNVLTSFQRIDQNLSAGGDRESCQLLFFVPSGEIWDSGYFDKLAATHCIAPYRIVYPVGYDGTSIAGAQLFCWDCNHPYSAGSGEAANCRLEFRLTDGEIRFDYYDGGNTKQFCSEDGFTLATMTNGKYLLSDHDMPFSGPLGVTTFVLDFLLSPADLLVENDAGQRTGTSAGSILAEIPDSHPCYMVKGAYLLPANEALTRHITGSANGAYGFHSIAPNGVSLSLENVATAPGQVDVLAANSDGTSLRFTPGAAKSFTLNLARESEGQARAVSITGVGGGPATALDINLTPDLSVVRVSNTDATRTVDVQVGALVEATGVNAKLTRNGVSLPTANDLLVTVTDWNDLALTVRALPFE